MPGRTVQAYKARSVVDGSPAAAAETIICTLSGISTVDADSLVWLNGQANFTVGTAGVNARLRIRETNVTGTVVADSGAVTGGIAAAGVISLDVQGEDQPGPVASFVYVMTLQIGSASAVSTVAVVSLKAFLS